MTSQLFLVTFRIKESSQPGMDLSNFLTKVQGFLRGYTNASKVIHMFKVTGEPRIVAVFDVFNVYGLERNMAGLSRMGIFEMTCLPLTAYETFAKALGVDGSLIGPSPHQLTKKFMYWLQFDVGYSGKSTDELLTIWRTEATTALGARVSGGTELDLFKVTAQRNIHVFIALDDPEEVEKLSWALPIMQQNGSNIKIECRSIQHLEEYTSRVMTEQL